MRVAKSNARLEPLNDPFVPDAEIEKQLGEELVRPGDIQTLRRSKRIPGYIPWCVLQEDTGEAFRSVLKMHSNIDQACQTVSSSEQVGVEQPWHKNISHFGPPEQPQNTDQLLVQQFCEKVARPDERQTHPRGTQVPGLIHVCVQQESTGAVLSSMPKMQLNPDHICQTTSIAEQAGVRQRWHKHNSNHELGCDFLFHCEPILCPVPHSKQAKLQVDCSLSPSEVNAMLCRFGRKMGALGDDLRNNVKKYSIQSGCFSPPLAPP